MNIQIFGKAKCFDTKKAERYFKERRIKFQLIDIAKYGISKGEYQSVKAAVGGMDLMIDEKSKEYKAQFIEHLAREDDIRPLHNCLTQFFSPCSISHFFALMIFALMIFAQNRGENALKKPSAPISFGL